MALELHDDYETLEAALALIDEWEVEMGALATSTTTPVSPSPSSDDCDARSTTTSTSTSTTTDDSDSSSPTVSPSLSSSGAHAAPPRRRRAREEDVVQDKTRVVATQLSRREELVGLRRKVRELEGVLASMRDGDNAVTVKQETCAAPSQRELDAAWVWQQIASRQLEHRQRAERENLKLRVQVEEQLKMAKEVMRVLLRAYRQDEQEPQEDRNARALKRVKLPQDARTEVSEEDQLRRVDELMDESAALFATAPFTGGLPVFRDVNVMQHANGEATINVDSSWVVPFPVGQVMSAFWTHLMRKTRSQCDYNSMEHCLAPDDGRQVLATRYESNATASKFAGKFFGRFVARRMHAEDQEPGFIIMDMCADPVGFSPMSMEGVRLHHETLMRVIWADQAANGNASASSCGRMSLIQTSQRVHVQLAAAETPTRRRRVGAMADFFMYQVEAELDWKQDLLETLLMRSALSSS